MERHSLPGKPTGEMPVQVRPLEFGEVAEWSMVLAWKASVGVTPPQVQILSSPCLFVPP